MSAQIYDRKLRALCNQITGVCSSGEFFAKLCVVKSIGSFDEIKLLAKDSFSSFHNALKHVPPQDFLKEAQALSDTNGICLEQVNGPSIPSSAAALKSLVCLQTATVLSKVNIISTKLQEMIDECDLRAKVIIIDKTGRCIEALGNLSAHAFLAHCEESEGFLDGSSGARFEQISGPEAAKEHGPDLAVKSGVNGAKTSRCVCEHEIRKRYPSIPLQITSGSTCCEQQCTPIDTQKLGRVFRAVFEYALSSHIKDVHLSISTACGLVYTMHAPVREKLQMTWHKLRCREQAARCALDKLVATSTAVQCRVFVHFQDGTLFTFRQRNESATMFSDDQILGSSRLQDVTSSKTVAVADEAVKLSRKRDRPDSAVSIRDTPRADISLTKYASNMTEVPRDIQPLAPGTRHQAMTQHIMPASPENLSESSSQSAAATATTITKSPSYATVCTSEGVCSEPPSESSSQSAASATPITMSPSYATVCPSEGVCSEHLSESSSQSAAAEPSITMSPSYATVYSSEGICYESVVPGGTITADNSNQQEEILHWLIESVHRPEYKQQEDVVACVAHHFSGFLPTSAHIKSESSITLQSTPWPHYVYLPSQSSAGHRTASLLATSSTVQHATSPNTMSSSSSSRFGGDCNDRPRVLGLCIGIDFFDAGQLADLHSCCNDARALASTVYRLTPLSGASVHCYEDIGRDEYLAGIQAFLDDVKRHPSIELIFVFMASHGFQLDSDVFLALRTTQAVPETIANDQTLLRAHLQHQTIDVHALIERIHACWTGPLAVIVDACRTAPIPELALTPSLQFNKADFPSNTLVCYSTSAGHESVDGVDDAHSPFVVSLLGRIACPGITIRSAVDFACNSLDLTEKPTHISVKFSDTCVVPYLVELFCIERRIGGSALELMLARIWTSLRRSMLHRAHVAVVLFGPGRHCPDALLSFISATGLRTMNGDSEAAVGNAVLFWAESTSSAPGVVEC